MLTAANVGVEPARRCGGSRSSTGNGSNDSLLQLIAVVREFDSSDRNRCKVEVDRVSIKKTSSKITLPFLPIKSPECPP